ncbi:MAG: Flp family type IVb pilin [Candidatus Methylacidiphilales bacterium]|nr:Flp family type IVb pilin [Candidatus Methylacidiphilales bacterium]
MIHSLYLLVASSIKPLLKRISGQTLIEYAMILALISMVTVAALTLMGGQLRTFFSRVTSLLT